MRGRFHPGNGHLYTCGLYAWAGNRQLDGGFYRVRATGKAANLPISLHAQINGMELQFSDALDSGAASEPKNYAIKVWALKRSADYGSKHLDEHGLNITKAVLSRDRKSVLLAIPNLQPTWSMEIKMILRGADGTPFSRTLHNTIHQLGGTPPRQ
jgi:hypothetical protein